MNTPAANFDPIARPYRWMEYLSFGPWLQLCRCHFLPRLGNRRHALVLGDGDGRFTARLLRHVPNIQVEAVDASEAMLAQLRRGTHALSVTTHCADARQWRPSQITYDLIATHFFLDCLQTAEVVDLAARLTPATAPNARWVISEFQTPPTAFGRIVAAPVVTLLYRAFRWLTGLEPQALPDHHTALAQAGWRFEAGHTHLWGLLVSELWQRNPTRQP